MKKQELSFEEAVKQLERIAEELEREGLSLDASLGLYEEGIKLVRYCNTILTEAERKVKLLSVNADGEIVEKDFEAISDNA